MSGNWCPLHADYCKVGCMFMQKMDREGIAQLGYDTHPDMPGVCGLRLVLDRIATSLGAIRTDGVKLQAVKTAESILLPSPTPAPRPVVKKKEGA